MAAAGRAYQSFEAEAPTSQKRAITMTSKISHLDTNCPAGFEAARIAHLKPAFPVKPAVVQVERILCRYLELTDLYC